MHPNATHDVARVWHSNVEGVIRITGDVSKLAAGGDGVTFFITVHNTTVFHRYLYKPSSEPVKVRVEVPVLVGQEVAFVARAGKSQDNDALYTFFTIEHSRKSLRSGFVHKKVVADAATSTHEQGRDGLFCVYRLSTAGAWLPLPLDDANEAVFDMSAVRFPDLGALAVGRYMMHPGVLCVSGAQVAAF